MFAPWAQSPHHLLTTYSHSMIRRAHTKLINFALIKIKHMAIRLAYYLRFQSQKIENYSS